MTENLKELKKELGLSNEKVAEISGIPLGTVQKYFGGATKHPRYQTIEAIRTALCKYKDDSSDAAREKASGYAADSSLYAGRILPEKTLREAQAVYGVRRERAYTVDDYYALPDDQRMELINGRFYAMGAPNSVHQTIVLMLTVSFSVFISRKGGDCKVFPAPFDIRLDRDSYTMVQPDLAVICDPGKIRLRCCYGAPDLAAEVLSPGNTEETILLKVAKYAAAGVRECWIIDPQSERILVYDFQKSLFPKNYTFSEQIPVGIWGGELVINFEEIRKSCSYIYENENDHKSVQL